MHGNTSVVVLNYSHGYMETLSRIHGAFYRMHENPQSIHGDIYRSIKIFTHSSARRYIWNYVIECTRYSIVYTKYPLGYGRAFGRIPGGILVECIKLTINYMKMLTWIRKATRSNTWKYSFWCTKLCIQMPESTHVATWNIEYVKYSYEYLALLTRIWNNQSNTRKYCIGCVRPHNWIYESTHLNIENYSFE